MSLGRGVKITAAALVKPVHGQPDLLELLECRLSHPVVAIDNCYLIPGNSLLSQMRCKGALFRNSTPMR